MTPATPTSAQALRRQASIVKLLGVRPDQAPGIDAWFQARNRPGQAALRMFASEFGTSRREVTRHA